MRDGVWVLKKEMIVLIKDELNVKEVVFRKCDP